MLKQQRNSQFDESRIDLKKSLARKELLWAGGSLEVPVIEFSEPLAKSLSFARRCGELRGGFENIETLLQKEEAGLVGRKIDRAKEEQISRLIIMSNDGSERFYRNCESLLLRYRDRVLGCRINLTGSSLGEKFFGKDTLVKVVMVSKKDFVVRVLLALKESEKGNER